MKILITGAAGFIGSNTVNFLIDRKHKIMAVDDFSVGKLENLKGVNPDRIKLIDIRDTTLMEMLMNQFRPDAILHLAAQSAITTAWKDPAKDLDINALGTINLLQLANKYDVKKFVFASTSAVYGKSRFMALREKSFCNPDTPYGASKLVSEHYIRMMFKNHVILRYANVYGPRQQPIGQNQLIARAFRHFLHGDDFKVVGSGKQARDFVYVDDVCNANYLSMMDNTVGTFNVASGTSWTVNDVLAEIAEAYEVPNYSWEHTETRDERGSVYMDAGLIRKSLGWKAYVGLHEGIQRTSEYWEVEKGN